VIIMTESSVNTDNPESTMLSGANDNAMQSRGVAPQEPADIESSVLDRLEAFAAELRQIRASRTRR
jgi:hypothetical protein